MAIHLRVSLEFCDSAADVTFQSSDGVAFKICRHHLQSCSAGLAVSDNLIVDEEPVYLQESSDVLEVLFQFIQPPAERKRFRQPLVRSLDPVLFFAVAEAAEKYIVYGAMNTFVTHMYQMIETHPLEVLNHCDRHGYSDLVDAAASKSIAQPLTTVLDRLWHPGLLTRWLRYYNHWRSVVANVDQQFNAYSYANCGRLRSAHAAYMHAVTVNLQLAASPPSVSSKLECPYDSCPCSHISELQALSSREAAAIPFFTEIS